MSTEILFPNKEVLLTTSEVITISPFTFGQLPKALKFANKLGVLAIDLYKTGRLDNKEMAASNIIAVISEGGDDLINLLSLSIGKPREWFDTLDTVDGIKLVTAFFEVNIDFFTKKVMPQLSEAMLQFKAAK